MAPTNYYSYSERQTKSTYNFNNGEYNNHPRGWRWHHMVRGSIHVHGQMGQANFSFWLEK